jgi:hypothetical protein
MSTTISLNRMLNRRVQPRRAVLAAVLALVSALSLCFAMAPGANASVNKFYNICVQTGTAAGAGTDSNVEVRIAGTKASTGWIVLDDSRNNFENGTNECFDIWSTDVGSVTSVTVWTDGDRNWFLSFIAVNGQIAGFHNWVPIGSTHIWAA